MEDKQIAAFLERLTKTEIMPTVPPPPATDLEDYRQLIARRFANPKIGDTITRLCLDGSNRQPKFILPTAQARLEGGQSIAGLALVSALWCRYVYGVSESGRSIAPNDDNWERLQAHAKRAKDDPKAYLEMRDIFGGLAADPAYIGSFSTALNAVWGKGVRATLDDYLNGRS